MGYALSTTVDRPYDMVLAQVRTALADQGLASSPRSTSRPR